MTNTNKKITQEDLLIQACQNGDLEYVKLYLSQGVDVNTKNNAPLKATAQYGKLEVMKYLIKHGADIRSEKDIIIKDAVYMGNLEIIKYLVEIGADVHAGNDHVLQYSLIFDYKKIIEYLVNECKFDKTNVYEHPDCSDEMKLWIKTEKAKELKEILEISLKNKTTNTKKIKV